jgi:cellulose synthase/poly-beta-1,6-N-acetylglucosamine synthase-like glycosyltransferase
MAARRRSGALESTPRQDWIAFLDADDVVTPDMLKQQVQLIEKYDGIRWMWVTCF